MWKLMKILGFDNDDDDYDDSEDYEEQPRPRKQKQVRRKETFSSSSSSSSSQRAVSSPKIVLFRGVPSENYKRRLREALKNDTMVLLDLHDLDERQFEEEGRTFITFMKGVAYARGGSTVLIEPAHYLVMPREDMFEQWEEEEPDE